MNWDYLWDIYLNVPIAQGLCGSYYLTRIISIESISEVAGFGESIEMICENELILSVVVKSYRLPWLS